MTTALRPSPKNDIREARTLADQAAGMTARYRLTHELRVHRVLTPEQLLERSLLEPRA